MANALTRSSHPKYRFGAYANVSWEEYRTNIPRGRGSFRTINLFREYSILGMYDGHAIRKVGQESENVYWYGQLVGHQPLALYLCVYVCMYGSCVRGHDPTPLGARPHIARHMNEWPTMKRSLV